MFAMFVVFVAFQDSVESTVVLEGPVLDKGGSLFNGIISVFFHLSIHVTDTNILISLKYI